MVLHARSPHGMAAPVLFGVGLALILSAAFPALAQGTLPVSGAAPASAVSAPPGPPPQSHEPLNAASLQAKLGRDKAARIESRIGRLRATLRITPAQEPLWRNFASVMRQNVVEMDAAYAKRQAGYGTMNAVQDLESYGAVEQTNARNVQLLLPPFRALYDSFSAEQKKTADATFLRYTERAVKKPG